MDYVKVLSWMFENRFYLSWVTFLVSGSVFVLPPQILLKLRLNDLPKTCNIFIGFAFLLSAVILITKIGLIIWDSVKKTKKAVMTERQEKILSRIRSLNRTQLEILQQIYDSGSDYFKLPDTAPIQGIERQGLVFSVSSRNPVLKGLPLEYEMPREIREVIEMNYSTLF